MRAITPDERGLTLTEVTIVAAIGLLVLLGLGGFYLNSQATWLDASSRAITQREATLVSEAIADSLRRCGSATVIALPDADHGQVALYAQGSTVPHWYFWWDGTDSLVHQGPTPGTGSAMHASSAERFRVVLSDSALVEITLRLRAGAGQGVELSTSCMLRNH